MPRDITIHVTSLQMTANEKRNSFSALVPYHSANVWYTAAGWLQDGLDALQQLAEELTLEDDPVTYAVLVHLCSSVQQQELCLRESMLQVETVTYILSLMGADGQHAPIVRSASAQLLGALILNQPSETLERVITAQCVRLVMEYLNAEDYSDEWLDHGLAIVTTAMNSEKLVQEFLRAGLVKTLHALFAQCAAHGLEKPQVNLLSVLWTLYKVGSLDLCLHSKHLLTTLIHQLESDADMLGLCDLRLAVLLSCLERVPACKDTPLYPRIVHICARILEHAPLAGNAVLQILALCVTARVSCAPARASTLDSTVLRQFVNEHCQVIASEEFGMLLAKYTELAQRGSPRTAKEDFLLLQVLRHTLVKLACCQMLTDCAKQQLLQTLQQLHDSGAVISDELAQTHHFFACSLITFPANNTSLYTDALLYILEHILAHEAYIELHGAESLVAMLLEIPAQHIAYSKVSEGIMSGLQVLLTHGPYAGVCGFPAHLRERVLKKLKSDGCLMLHQTGFDKATEYVLDRVLTSPEDVLVLFTGDDATFLARIFDTDTMSEDAAYHTQDMESRVRFLVHLVVTCQRLQCNPPENMVKGVAKIREASIRRLVSTCKTCDHYDDAFELSLWWALLVVCQHAKYAAANEVLQRVREPLQLTEAFTASRKRLALEIQKMARQIEESERIAQALLQEEEEQAGPAKKTKSKKKKGGLGEAAQQSDPHVGAAGAVAQPAPAPVDKDEQAGPAKKTKSKKKSDPQVGAAGAVPIHAAAAAASEPGDTTALPSPPRASSECDAAGECVVCLERPAQVAVIPCGHVCVCTECAQDQNLCPICRAAVERMLRLFFPASH